MSAGFISAEMSTPSTNLELLSEVVDTVWQELRTFMPTDENKIIQLERSDTNIVIRDWAIRRLENICYDNSIRVISNIDTLNPNWILAIDIINIGCIYTQCGRNGLFGKRWIERKVVFKLNVQCHDQTGLLIFSKTFNRDKHDRILASQLAYVEQNDALIDFPDPPGYKDLFSRSEPWFMIASVTAVIYLFYIIRS